MSTFNGPRSGRSSIGYSFTKVDNTNFQEATAFHKGEYASANLLWAPAGYVFTGAELMWGKRTDNDGETGTDPGSVQLQMVLLEQEHLGHGSNNEVLQMTFGSPEVVRDRVERHRLAIRHAL